ncbi:MAG TPA: 50S ribosomal protein L30 [Gammaproteobacteria bacterium]|nr:50S ribosomal protein L30 [Gammaproteobacteria bacterium]
MASKGSAKQLRLTQTHSAIGRLKSHQACLRGLGLRRPHHSVVVADTPENQGMIRKVAYMLKIEEA